MKRLVRGRQGVEVETQEVGLVMSVAQGRVIYSSYREKWRQADSTIDIFMLGVQESMFSEFRLSWDSWAQSG